MFAKSILALSTLLLSARAIKVTSPSNTTSWTTSGSQIIQWTSVSTDPSNFTIQLYPPSSPNDPQILAATILTDSKSYTYTPSSSLSAGREYRINFVADNGGILAQSDYFEVKSGTSTVSASSRGASASTSAGFASSSSIAAGNSATSNAAAAYASASTSATGAASHLTIPGSLLLVVAGTITLFA